MQEKKDEYLIVISLLSALIVFILGFNSLMGYILNVVSLYTWSGSIAMALPTAIGFAFSGISVICLCFYKNGKQSE